MRWLDIPTTVVYEKNFRAKERFASEGAGRFVLNEGGTGSSKTYSLCHLILALAIENKERECVISVVRKTFPALRGSAMRDFFNILKRHNLYDPELHDMSEHIYHVGKCEIEFFSCDNEKKLRGRRRDYLWINEANEVSSEDFFQLNIRTNRQIFMDYNPSDVVHWIYSHPEINRDCVLINSTFEDNPFLAPAVREQILALKETDDEYWTVYGLGKRARSKKLIYTNWDTCKEIPELADDVFYGLDFGHTAPTALIEIRRKDNELWERELIYEGMTNSELIVRLAELRIPFDAEIWADSEAPDRIEEIRNAGWRNVRPARKGEGSVEFGIGVVKSYKVHVKEDSLNLIKEKQSYKWRTDAAGNIMDGKPHKFLDHLMDAERYAVAGHCVEAEPEMEVIFA